MNEQIGIYKITSPSGKIYIGQSWNIAGRIIKYKSETNSRKQRILHASLCKYGWENHKFETLCNLQQENISQSLLDDFEIFYINLYRQKGNRLLNIKDGGRGGKLPLEAIEKMLNTRGKWKHTEETKMKMRELALKNNIGERLHGRYIFYMQNISGEILSLKGLKQFMIDNNISSSSIFNSHKQDRFIKGWKFLGREKINKD